jgi:hypothetical protein
LAVAYSSHRHPVDFSGATTSMVIFDLVLLVAQFQGEQDNRKSIDS